LFESIGVLANPNSGKVAGSWGLGKSAWEIQGGVVGGEENWGGVVDGKEISFGPAAMA
jgi:hypothetical protein